MDENDILISFFYSDSKEELIDECWLSRESEEEATGGQGRRRPAGRGGKRPNRMGRRTESRRDAATQRNKQTVTHQRG